MPISHFLNVAFIAGTLGTGGAERQLYYLIKNLTKDGYKVTLICLTQGEHWEEPIRKLGVNIQFAGKSDSRLKRLLKMVSIIRQDKPNIIYSFHFYTNLYAGVMGRMLGIKSMGSIRSDGFSEKAANGILSWLHYAIPHRIVANSIHGRDNTIKAFYKRPVHVLDNVIDTDQFPFQIRPLKRPLELIFVGRLEEQKQPMYFVQLIKKLKDAGIESTGEIYGKGSLKSTLQAEIVTLGLESEIQLRDVVHHLEPVYARANFILSFSKYEGTPNVLLEAMACGLPVISFPFEGIEKLIVDDTYGLITSSVDEMVEQIIYLTKKPDLYQKMGKNGREYIIKSYDLKNQLFNFESILNSL